MSIDLALIGAAISHVRLYINTLCNRDHASVVPTLPYAIQNLKTELQIDCLPSIADFIHASTFLAGIEQAMNVLVIVNIEFIM